MSSLFTTKERIPYCSESTRQQRTSAKNIKLARITPQNGADFLTPENEILLTELLCSQTDHARREAIGVRLAEIESTDPRPGVGVIDGVLDILWCEISPGNVALPIEEPERPDSSLIRRLASRLLPTRYESIRRILINSLSTRFASRLIR